MLALFRLIRLCSRLCFSLCFSLSVRGVVVSAPASVLMRSKSRAFSRESNETEHNPTSDACQNPTTIPMLRAKLSQK